MNGTRYFFALLLCSLWQPVPSKAGMCLSKQAKPPTPKNMQQANKTHAGKRGRSQTFSASPPASTVEESRSSRVANPVQK